MKLAVKPAVVALLLTACGGEDDGPTPAFPEVGPSPKVVDKDSWPPKLETAPEVETKHADKLVVVNVGQPLRPDHPFDPMWALAPYLDVKLAPQQVAMPVLEKGTIDSLRVQGLHDGNRIAFRISWADRTADGNVDAGRFADAVALQFPLDDTALAMMGHKGAKVFTLYWKALWQKDRDMGFQDVQDLHPNYWTDFYWFAKGRFPFPLPSAFEDPVSHQWFPAKQAGNPMSIWDRDQPVEELTAEGFGTLTHQKHSETTGRGFWVDGRWAVVFSRPMKTKDPLDYQFDVFKPGRIAFAVWDGSAGNRGGRKHWSENWLGFEMKWQVVQK